MKTNEELLQDVLKHLDSLSPIKPSDIPNIDLYMDQVTTFMEHHMENNKRFPEEKVLTKTMINNYAKNRLLPAPVRKRYSQEHILMLIFIYYYKNMLNFEDISQLLEPISDRHFSKDSSFSLESVYNEILTLEQGQRSHLKDDVMEKYVRAEKSFQDAPESEKDYLQLFGFVSELAFDVYLKKQMIERIIDQMKPETPPGKKK